MRRGEVSAAPGVEQIFDSIEVKEESVAASASEECVGTGFDDVSLGAEGHRGVGDYGLADGFDGAGLRACCREDVYRLLAVLRRREHVTNSDVRQAISVVVDVKAVDGVGMERVCGRICIGISTVLDGSAGAWNA